MAQSTTNTNYTTHSVPTNGMGTININISNPTAMNNPQVGGCYPRYPYCGMPCSCYPAFYYMPMQIPQMQPQQAYQTQTQGQNQSQNQSQSQSINTTITQPAEKKKKREVVVLTNEYIKTLENYLRNPNKEVRQMGVKELLERFKEDKSRIDNKPLNALLNIALQDPDPTVKTIAMSIPISGYAIGNELTAGILKQIEKSTGAYNQDAILAAESALKLAEKKITVDDNAHVSKFKEKLKMKPKEEKKS